MLGACSPQAPAANAAADPSPPSGLRQIPLVIHSSNGDHRFTVEVAQTPEEQERGLMFRTALGPQRGMIFPYDPPQNVSFWMKNTLIPLDMIFIREDHRVARIADSVTPQSLDTVPAGEPVIAVLEIAGGRSNKLKIKAGDLVEW